MEQQRLKRPNDGPPKRCPRCDSANTKFCYFNNYSASQPRHFCKACRRYWTEGGTLRNVPQGGGGGHKRRRPRRKSPAAASTAAAPAVLINLPERPLDNNQGPEAAAVAIVSGTPPRVSPSLYLGAGGRRMGGGVEACMEAPQALNAEAINLGGVQPLRETLPLPLNHPLLSGFNYRIPQQQQLGFQLGVGVGALHQLLPMNTNLMVQPWMASTLSQQGWQLSTSQMEQEQQPNTSVLTSSTNPPSTTAGEGVSSDAGESLWTNNFTGAGGSHWAAELSGRDPHAHSSPSFI